MKLLYIARELGKESNGASQVMRRNRDVLKKLIGSGFNEFLLPPLKVLSVVKSIFQNVSYGVELSVQRSVLKKIKEIKPDIVFIDSTSYGALVKDINTIGFKTICFAHNVDTVLCRQELSSRTPLISVPKLVSTYLNEKRTMKYADKIISLNKRDSQGFDRLFGRPADFILPITFDIRPEKNITSEASDNRDPYFLFVGSNFFPNVEGIKWFLEKVAPKIKYKIRIVGSCCYNKSVKSVKISRNVTLVGYAEDINKEYVNACGVIAPIFKGSGMKTKTIEAMSYGKSIYGTTEAFVGVEGDFSRIGGVCNTEDEFIQALNSSNLERINDYVEKLFETNFSNEYFENQIKNILGYE